MPLAVPRLHVDSIALVQLEADERLWSAQEDRPPQDAGQRECDQAHEHKFDVGRQIERDEHARRRSVRSHERVRERARGAQMNARGHAGITPGAAGAITESAAIAALSLPGARRQPKTKKPELFRAGLFCFMGA